MSELSERFHGFSPEEERAPMRNGIKPRVNNDIGPGSLHRYGLHLEHLENPQLPLEGSVERRAQPEEEEFEMLRAIGYIPAGWNRGEKAVLMHPEWPDILAHNPETERYEKIN